MEEFLCVVVDGFVNGVLLYYYIVFKVYLLENDCSLIWWILCELVKEYGLGGCVYYICGGKLVKIFDDVWIVVMVNLIVV